MSVPTTRSKDNATIIIDESKCNGCGLCVSVCKDFSLEIKDNKARVADSPFFGCIGCGHCMAICPKDAIKIEGRCISSDDLEKIQASKNTAGYDDLLRLLRKRRSIREFRERDVEKKIINRIIEAASTAPMGLPPSDVNILVLDSVKKVRAFSFDFCDYLGKMQWLISKPFLTVMRPFWGKENSEVFKSFVKPMFKAFTEGRKKGENLVLYDAPLAFYFYGSPYSDPADPVVAATYAMIAAESMGLGSCMIGSIHPLIQNGREARRFREEHGIRCRSREGIFVVMGYPAVKYRYSIKRTFANVDFL